MGDALSYPGFLGALASLRTALALQVKDLRSAIAREVCTLLVFLAKELRNSFESEADFYIPALIPLTCVSVAVISQSGHACILEILHYRYVTTSYRVLYTRNFVIF